MGKQHSSRRCFWFSWVFASGKDLKRLGNSTARVPGAGFFQTSA